MAVPGVPSARLSSATPSHSPLVFVLQWQCHTRWTLMLDCSRGLQIAHVLKLGSPSTAQNGLYVCLAQALSADAAVLRSSRQVLELLQSRAHIAESVLTAPCAHRDTTSLTLTQLYAALDAELHGAATRGFFGADSNEWLLDATDDAAASTNERTAQVLSQQQHVTSLRVIGDVTRAPHAPVLTHLVHAKQLTAVAFKRVAKEETDSYGGGFWHNLAYICATVCRLLADPFNRGEDGCAVDAQSLPALCPVIVSLRQLKSIALEGRYIMFMSSADRTGVAAFVSALAQHTALDRLALCNVPFTYAHQESLGRVLATMSRLRSLDLRGSYALSSAATATALASCPHLTELNVADTGLSENSDSLEILCGLRGCLLSLTLDRNICLGKSGMRRILAAPGILGLTRLCMRSVGVTMDTDGDAIEWPWQQLCRLTELRELRMGRNRFGDVGAAALGLHIGALAKLQILDVGECDIGSAEPFATVVFKLPQLKVLRCKQTITMLVPFLLPREAKCRGVVLK